MRIDAGHPLAVVLLAEGFLLQCSKLGPVTAGEMHGENCKFSYAFDKICPVGFGQGWWVCRVVQGAFRIWPLGSAEGE